MPINSRFSCRRPLSAGEILNCDLSDRDTKELDAYNNYYFYESAVTDFYERDPRCGGSGGGGSGVGGGGTGGGGTFDGGRGYEVLYPVALSSLVGAAV